MEMSPQELQAVGVRFRHHVPTILIVEDDRESCRLLELLLTSTGCDLTFASTAAEAIEQLERQPPALAIIDIYLPGKEKGWAVADFIKSSAAHRDIPVILISAGMMTRKEDDSPADTGGKYEGQYQKPIDVRAFTRQVQSLLGLVPG